MKEICLWNGTKIKSAILPNGLKIEVQEIGGCGTRYMVTDELYDRIVLHIFKTGTAYEISKDGILLDQIKSKNRLLKKEIEKFKIKLENKKLNMNVVK